MHMCVCVHANIYNRDRINPVNMPDPIRMRFGYGQLRLLRTVCSQNQARLYMPDLTSHI